MRKYGIQAFFFILACKPIYLFIRRNQTVRRASCWEMEQTMWWKYKGGIYTIPSLTSLRTRRRPELASPLTHSVEGHHPHHVHFYWSSHSLEYHIMNRHYVRPFGTWGHIEWWPLIIEIINGHPRVSPQVRSLRAHAITVPINMPADHYPFYSARL